MATITGPEGNKGKTLSKHRIMENMQMSKNYVLTSCRQGGKTTLELLYVLWRMKFFENQTILHIYPKTCLSEHFRNVLYKLLIENKVEVTRGNSSRLETEYGNKVEFGNNPSHFRGCTPSLAIFSEPAYNDKIHELIRDLFPVTMSHSECQTFLIGTKCHKNDVLYRAYLRSHSKNSNWTGDHISWESEFEPDEIWTLKDGAGVFFSVEYEEYFKVEYPVVKSKVEEFFEDKSGEFRVLCDAGLLNIKNPSLEFQNICSDLNPEIRKSNVEIFVSQEKKGTPLKICKVTTEEIHQY